MVAANEPKVTTFDGDETIEDLKRYISELDKEVTNLRVMVDWAEANGYARGYENGLSRSGFRTHAT